MKRATVARITTSPASPARRSMAVNSALKGSATQRLERAMKKQRSQAKKATRERIRTAMSERTNVAAAPGRPGGGLSRGEFYAWCKATGKLWLYFKTYPEG